MMIWSEVSIITIVLCSLCLLVRKSLSSLDSNGKLLRQKEISWIDKIFCELNLLYICCDINPVSPCHNIILSKKKQSGVTVILCSMCVCVGMRVRACVCMCARAQMCVCKFCNRLCLCCDRVEMMSRFAPSKPVRGSGSEGRLKERS